MNNRRLPLVQQPLCPQEYDGATMWVVTCNSCAVGWDKGTGACRVGTGAEHLPDAKIVPDCPIAARCRHQIQAGDSPCEVRRKGMICESSLVFDGLARGDATGHPIAFHAIVVAEDESVYAEEYGS